MCETIISVQNWISNCAWMWLFGVFFTGWGPLTAFVSLSPVKYFQHFCRYSFLYILFITTSFQGSVWCHNKTQRPEAVTPTVTVGHAVEEEPGGICAAVLHKGHVVTGFDAQHGEQLHPLAGETALPPRTVLQLLGDGQFAVPMGFPPRVEVNLNRNNESQQTVGACGVFKVKQNPFNLLHMMYYTYRSQKIKAEVDQVIHTARKAIKMKIQKYFSQCCEDWQVKCVTIYCESFFSATDFCTDTLRFLWIWRHQMADPDPHLTTWGLLNWCCNNARCRCLPVYCTFHRTV